MSPNAIFQEADEVVTVKPCSNRVSNEARSSGSTISDSDVVYHTSKHSVLSSEFFIPNDSKNQGQSKNKRTKKTLNCKSSVCVII